MRLWIGLHLCQLPLDVFCPSWSADEGSVVLDQERVLACSPAAAELGVLPGMRRGGVLMLAPEARLHLRSLEREAEALQAVSMALLQYTPLVAQAEEAVLLMDVGASLRLFGGVRALCRAVRGSVKALGFSATLSCASTARGAWLLARQGGRHDTGTQASTHGIGTQAGTRSMGRLAGRRVLGMASLVRRLDRLPVALLPPARPFSDWFEGIGCTTLGAMRRLPRPGLQRRCGRALLDMLDAAHGMTPELFDWIEAPTTFHATLELFDRVEHADQLLHGAQRLLLQLTGWLCAHQLAVERIQLLLDHERGRQAVAPTVLEIVLAEPTWRDEHLVRLLRERLAKLELTAPVINLGLDVLQVQPMAPPSAQLFPTPGGSEQDQQRLFELLAARLGPDNVLQAAPQADYRPELANLWLPVQHTIRPAQREANMPPDVQSLPRPVWLLAKPIALLLRNHRPFYGSPLKLASAPERIEAGWWSAPQTRDYFIAEGEDRIYYWVYRERIVGSAAELRWYLHGLFA
jgi:protein ImuB